MKSFMAFFKKEILESVRSGKLLILGILFLIFGIMNPAIAKLTPWMYDILSDSLAESGMIVTEVTVDALTSWTQFFKNIPMALIVFVLIYGGIFTKEYESGTLILVLTKGLSRYKVVLAKATVMLLLWTIGYWFCFAVTYGYNAYYWDNSIADSLMPAVLHWWLFGIWTISCVVFFSTLSKSYTGVLLGTGGCILVSYLLGMLPKVSSYVPTSLMNSASLLVGNEAADIYTKAIIITVLMCCALIAAGIPVMNRRQL